ncbi:MAG: PaaI family thioesterase [Hyphomonas sp.]|uniref:PaaI family thioesterase n=1 Tax=Hyphomonas sp. TaxID=87 RepID=UPI0035283F73
MTAQASHKAPPPGFALRPTRGKFSIHNGPSYLAEADGDIRSGMWVLDRHCNGHGFMHGGMICAFADSALAWAVWLATGRSSVTIKLTMEFMDIVQEGTWLEAHPEVKGIDGELVHVMCTLVKPGGALVARADAVFRCLRRKSR